MHARCFPALYATRYRGGNWGGPGEARIDAPGAQVRVMLELDPLGEIELYFDPAAAVLMREALGEAIDATAGSDRGYELAEALELAS